MVGAESWGADDYSANIASNPARTIILNLLA